jgi:hypothetical protein
MFAWYIPHPGYQASDSDFTFVRYDNLVFQQFCNRGNSLQVYLRKIGHKY